MIKVQLTREAKKRNSTKSVTSNIDEYDCELKYPTSIERPTLLLHMRPTTAQMADYSMAVIPYFRRTYFIVECRSISSTQWEIDLEVDVLASYRSEILKSTAFVKYSSIIYNDRIIDNRLPTIEPALDHIKNDGDYTYTRVEKGHWFTLEESEMTYVLTSVGAPGGIETGFGAVTTYIMDRRGAENLSNELAKDDILSKISRYFTNPYDAILSIYRLPLHFTGITHGGQLGEMHDELVLIGGAEIDIGRGYYIYNGKAYSDGAILGQNEFKYTDYRLLEGTEITLYLPGCESITIDPKMLDVNDTLSTINVTTLISLQDGTVCHTISIRGMLLEESYVLGKFYGQIGVRLAIGAKGSNVGALVTAAAMGTAALTAPVLVPALVEGAYFSGEMLHYGGAYIASTIGMTGSNLIQSMRQHHTSSQAYGSIAEMYGNTEYRLTIHYNQFSDEPDNIKDRMGRPLFKMDELANHEHGFVICDMWSHEVNCTQLEYSLLTGYMNGRGGVYLE